jgi:hypothetical protein
MSYCKCSGANKTKGFTCKQHCKYDRPKKSRKPAKKKSRKPAKKKSRKPAKKKSRKPAKKKSRKPAKKKSRKSKSKFKVRKDRVFTKHGQIGSDGRLKKQKLPSLFDLAAQKLPLTSEWAKGSDPDLKLLVTKPQQKRLKSIMGSDLIKEVASREQAATIEPLSEREIKFLMEEAFDFDDLRKIKNLPNLLMLEGDVNVVYSTLKNLRKLPVGYQTSNIWKMSQRFFHSLPCKSIVEQGNRYPVLRPHCMLHDNVPYAERRREAKENYLRSLRENLQEVKDRIQAVKEKVQSDGGSFNFERDFSFEDEQNNILYGSDAARVERQFLDRMALNEYNDLLADAESNRNDLYNYAKAVIANYFHYNDRDWLMNDFGENNELYHEYKN